MQSEISARGGEIRFDVFMDLALNHEQYGYYASDTPRYGRSGDFLTAPTASHWYASVVARLCREISTGIGPLTLVDLASGDGSFINGVLNALDGSGVLKVVSIERSPSMRSQQQEKFKTRPVSIHSSLSEAPKATGPVIVHASELYDALPVRRVIGVDSGLNEFWVGLDDDALVWRMKEADSEVFAYLDQHHISLVPDQIAEINLGAEKLHGEILDWAGDQAATLVLDYGYEARRLYNPRGRLQGSLACYREHILNRDPLSDPGQQDITAHVNWDDLRRAADSRKSSEVGLWPLAEFLMRAGLPEEIESRKLGMEADLTAAVMTERQEIKRLLDPEGMGSDLKVLVQASEAVHEAVAAALVL